LLYQLLRNVEQISLLYRLRGQASSRKRRLSEKLGYSGDSRFYRILRRTLMQEGVLDRTGRFIENPPNILLAKFPDYVPFKDAGKTIGYKIPYTCFLALLLSSEVFVSSYRMASELELNYVSTYSGIRSLTRRGLVSEGQLSISNSEIATHLSSWLRRYLATAIEQARVSDDTSRLFKAVPAYIDGLEAMQKVNYEAGMPVGPAHMIIRTFPPFLEFWRNAVRTVEHLAKRSDRISVELAQRKTKIIWITGLPYSRDPIP